MSLWEPVFAFSSCHVSQQQRVQNHHWSRLMYKTFWQCLILRIKLAYWEQLFRFVMWSKTEHCCKCLTADFFIGTYYPSNLRIWTNGTKEPSNLVPGTCILVNVFILLQDLHFIWITQIAICKIQMTKMWCKLLEPVN